MANKTFVLHDETVNTYGFRMLTDGANLAEFRKNPVMLLDHMDWKLPIGRWENIRKEGGKILADAVFDMRDPNAAEVARKVDENFIRMASIGAWPPEEKTDDLLYKLPGQPFIRQFGIPKSLFEMLVITAMNGIFLLVNYQKLKISIFDPEYAQLIGIQIGRAHV